MLISARILAASEPLILAMSSWYFSSVPNVSLMTSGDSSSAVERVEGACPVEGLGHTRQLEEVLAAERVHEGDDLSRQALLDAGQADADDLELALGGRIVDPVVEAAALEGVVDLARAVRGHDHDRRLLGPDRADLGDGDLEVREDLQQERLERLVGPIELVDEQDRSAAGRRLEGLQQRPLDQELPGEDVLGQSLAVGVATRLRQADLEHLAGIVPLVDGRGHVQPLVALEADQPPAERLCQHLGDLGLAHAGLALEKERPAEGEGQEQGGGQRPVGDIASPGQKLQGRVDGGRNLGHGAPGIRRDDRRPGRNGGIKHERARRRKPGHAGRLPMRRRQAAGGARDPGFVRKLGDVMSIAMRPSPWIVLMRLKVALALLRADPAHWRRMRPWLALSLLVLAATLALTSHAVRFAPEGGQFLRNPTLAAGQDGQPFAGWEVRGAPRLVDGALVLENADPKKTVGLAQQLAVPPGVRSFYLEAVVGCRNVVPGPDPGWQHAMVYLVGRTASGAKVYPDPYTLFWGCGTRAPQRYADLFAFAEPIQSVTLYAMLIDTTGQMTVSGLSMRAGHTSPVYRLGYLPLALGWVLVILGGGWLLVATLRSRWLAGLLVAAVTGSVVLLLMSAVPREAFLGLVSWLLHLRDVDPEAVADWGHFTLFVIMSTITAFGARRERRWQAFLILVCLAALFEAVQLMTDDRSAQISDWLRNSAGVLVGIGTGSLLRGGLRVIRPAGASP